MKLSRIGCWGAFLLLLFVGAAHAGETAPRPWGAVSSTFGPCGMGVPAGVFAIGGNILYGESDGVWRHEKRLNGNTETTKFNQVLKMRYGLVEGLDIRTATPHYNIHLDQKTGSDRTNYGIGDTTVLLHKSLLNQDQGDPLFLGLDFGGVAPTASVGEHSADALGNDAWGAILGLGATWFQDSHRFDLEVNYATFSEGAKDYAKGDRLRWNTGYAYALSGMWDLGVESSYEWNAASELHDKGQHNSGTEWFVGPKLTFNYKPWQLHTGVAVKLPVYRWYEGTKVGSDDYRLEMKIIKAFKFESLF